MRDIYKWGNGEEVKGKIEKASSSLGHLWKVPHRLCFCVCSVVILRQGVGCCVRLPFITQQYERYGEKKVCMFVRKVPNSKGTSNQIEE